MKMDFEEDIDINIDISDIDDDDNIADNRVIRRYIRDVQNPFEYYDEDNFKRRFQFNKDSVLYAILRFEQMLKDHLLEDDLISLKTSGIHSHCLRGGSALWDRKNGFFFCISPNIWTLKTYSPKLIAKFEIVTKL